MTKPREENFVHYYCLSIYTLKVAIYTLETAKDYCKHSTLKRVLDIAAKGLESKIVDITLKLRRENLADIKKDLASEDLHALGNILQELVISPGIACMEDDIIKAIREKKNA